MRGEKDSRSQELGILGFKHQAARGGLECETGTPRPRDQKAEISIQENKEMKARLILRILLILILAISVTTSSVATLTNKPVGAQEVDCIATHLAKYTAAILSGLDINDNTTPCSGNVCFLTPAFNMSRPEFENFADLYFEALNSEGYGIGNFHAVAGDAYNTSWGTISYFVSIARGTSIGNKDMILTEIGWYPHNIDESERPFAVNSLAEEIRRFPDLGVIGGLIFDQYGYNRDYRAQSLSEEELIEVRRIAGDSPSASLRDLNVGANSAVTYFRYPDFYTYAAGDVMKYTLEVAHTGDVATSVLSGIQAAHGAEITPIVRFGVGMNSTGAYPPENVVEFIEKLNGAGINRLVLVMLGPNEPLGECWATTPMCRCDTYATGHQGGSLCKAHSSPSQGGFPPDTVFNVTDPDCPGQTAMIRLPFEVVPPAGTNPPEGCSDFDGYPSLEGLASGVNRWIAAYRAAADEAAEQTGEFPWQVLAAIHYMESGFRGMEETDYNPFQIAISCATPDACTPELCSPAGVPYRPCPDSNPTMFEAALGAAHFLIYQKRYGGSRAPTAVQNAFFAYNGAYPRCNSREYGECGYNYIYGEASRSPYVMNYYNHCFCDMPINWSPTHHNQTECNGLGLGSLSVWPDEPYDPSAGWVEIFQNKGAYTIYAYLIAGSIGLDGSWHL